MSDKFLMNRLANAKNNFQGEYKRVLAVCSAGLLRSPTTAFVLSQEPYNYNTRAAGLTPEFALVPVDSVLLHWADEIVCMSEAQAVELYGRLLALGYNKPVISLDIEDNFEYRNPKLVKLIRERYDGAQEAMKGEDEKK